MSDADVCQKPSTEIQPKTNNWVSLVSDEEAMKFFTENDFSESKDKAEDTVKNLRKFAQEGFSWPDSHPIFDRVKSGFDFQIHASTLGPCFKNWRNVGQLQLKNKELTADSLVFWIPRIVPNSCKKTASGQLKLLGNLRRQYDLPEICLSSFGSASLLPALILSHHNQTNERVPLDRVWVRSDTLCVDGSRLSFGGFDAHGLVCFDWHWFDVGYSDLACFPLGVFLARSARELDLGHLDSCP